MMLWHEKLELDTCSYEDSSTHSPSSQLPNTNPDPNSDTNPDFCPRGFLTLTLTVMLTLTFILVAS